MVWRAPRINSKRRPQPKHHNLVAWAIRARVPLNEELTAERLVEHLTVEALPHDEVPARFYRPLVEFRRLRSDARVAACQAVLEHLDKR